LEVAGLKVTADMRQLKEFKKKLARLSLAKRIEWSEAAVKELAAQLLARVVNLTPVRTGHLRRMWTVSAVRNVGNGFEIDVFNNTEYAPYVEYGHRTSNGGWVNGRFMLTVSEAELQADAPRILMRRLNKFMRDNFR
jgi:hypothetical protein